MEPGTDSPVEICRCEAVKRAAVDAAIAAGAMTVNDVKRRTRCGMGLCQGVYCMPQIAALLAERLGEPLVEIAPMTARAPVRPLPLEELAGS
ncbi:MAG TPA: (2Fe-2S)-binding protein [Thermomicrobiales bacterium]|jgi:NAD(P)H-nitrite reductase large subunit|nr:(2Fe-2S)-binding protein [Thermomicrobiales bacterium]